MGRDTETKVMTIISIEPVVKVNYIWKRDLKLRNKVKVNYQVDRHKRHRQSDKAKPISEVLKLS